jgi:hypothetical protein
MQTMRMTLAGHHLWTSDKVLLGNGVADRVAESRLVENGHKTIVTFESRHPLTLGECEKISAHYGAKLLELAPV